MRSHNYIGPRTLVHVYYLFGIRNDRKYMSFVKEFMHLSIKCDEYCLKAWKWRCFGSSDRWSRGFPSFYGCKSSNGNMVFPTTGRGAARRVIFDAVLLWKYNIKSNLFRPSNNGQQRKPYLILNGSEMSIDGH